MEKEADEPGLDAGGGVFDGFPHDILRGRARVGIVTDLEPRGRARRRISRWERIPGPGPAYSRGLIAPADVD